MVNEADPSGRNEQNKRLDAELGMVRVMEEMIMADILYIGYLTHIVDPRNFTNKAEAEDVPVALGIARRGAIARVTTKEELDQCVLITPRIEEGKLGIAVKSSPQMQVPVELGVHIDKLTTGVESIQKAVEWLGRKG